MRLMSLLLVLWVVAVAMQARPLRQTQAELNETTAKDLKAAEAEMTLLMDRLVTKAAGKADAIAKLTQAQGAWKAYRDAQIEAMWPFPERRQYGSVYPMCVAQELTKLTKVRIAELRKMLTAVEGEVCNSQWPD